MNEELQIEYNEILTILKVRSNFSVPLKQSSITTSSTYATENPATL